MNNKLSLIDYLKQFTEPFTQKAILIFSAMSSVFLGFLDNYIGLSYAMFVVYFCLALMDLSTGMYKNIIFNGKKYESKLFLKKLVVFMMMILSIGMMTVLMREFKTIEVPFTMLEVFSKSVLYLFSVAKIFVIVAFIGYELSSIKENTDEVKWKRASEVLGIILLPLTWIKNSLKRSLNKNGQTDITEN